MWIFRINSHNAFGYSMWNTNQDLTVHYLHVFIPGYAVNDFFFPHSPLQHILEFIKFSLEALNMIILHEIPVDSTNVDCH